MPPDEGEEKQNPMHAAPEEIDQAICDLGGTISAVQDEAGEVRDDYISEPYVTAAYKRGWAAGVEYASLIIDEARTRAIRAVEAAFDVLKKVS